VSRRVESARRLTRLRPTPGLIPASLAGMRVLELGAGIGRFTGSLATRQAAHVHAVDFMENLIAEARPGMRAAGRLVAD
jgi:2-polyprenyl-3-methyl-5-hydroxy-6-metoxy-1,4-benzoquinol methylase